MNFAYREASRICEEYFEDYALDLDELAVMVDAINVWQIDDAIGAIETSARGLQLSHMTLLETKAQWEAAFGADPDSEHHILLPEVLEHNAKKTAEAQADAWRVMATLTSYDFDTTEQWNELRELSVRLYDDLKDLGT